MHPLKLALYLHAVAFFLLLYFFPTLGAPSFFAIPQGKKSKCNTLSELT